MGGFTLMELLVALGVSSLVALAGSALVAQGLGYFSRGEQRVKAFEQRRAVERLIRHEWRHRGATFNGDAQQVFFEATSTGSGHIELGVAEVRYFCDSDSRGIRLERELQSLPPARWAATAGAAARPAQGASAASGSALPVPQTRIVERETLADRLALCRFAYLELKPDRQGKMIPRWVDAWPVGTPAPALLRLEIEDADAPRMPALVFEALRRHEGGPS